MNKLALIAVLVAVTLMPGCIRTSPGDGDEGSETHWLQTCESSKECGEGSCICGYCTQRCNVASNCPAPLDACVHDESHPLFAECTPGEEAGLCAFASGGPEAPASESAPDVAADSGPTATSPDTGEPVDAPPPVPNPTTDAGDDIANDDVADDDDSSPTDVDAATGEPEVEVVSIRSEESATWTWEECGRIPSVAPTPYVTPIFAPDGSGLVVEDGQGQFQKYTLPLDQSQPQPLRPADAPAGVKIAFSPDGTLLLEAGSELVVRDLADGSVSVALELPADCERDSLAMSEDHRLALTSGASGSCIFDLDSGVLLSRLPSADSIAFRDDELVAASCPGDLESRCQLTVYSPDGSELTSSELVDTAGEFRSGTWPAAVSPAGETVAALGITTAGTLVVIVWNTSDARVRWARAVPAAAATRPIYSPSGDLLVTAEGSHQSDDGTLIVSASDTLVRHLVAEPALSPDGLSIATDWGPSLLDIATEGSSRLFRTHWQDSEVTDLALSADGTLMVSHAETVVGWRVAEAFGETQPVWSASSGGPALYVAMSPNGDFATISGDRQQMFDARNGVLLLPGLAPAAPADICIAFQFNFSPDSRYVAGKRYYSFVSVYDTQTLSVVGSFETTGCGQGVAFSPDGTLIHTPEGSFSTTDWKPVTPLRELPHEALPGDALYDVEVASDGAMLLHTDCTPEDGCRSTLSDTEADLTALDGVEKRTRRHLSSEGHWVVGGGVLVHWPSGAVVNYAEGATAARFAPNGDIVAGFANGELARYCRSGETP